MTSALDDAYAAWKGWGDPSAHRPGDTQIWDALHSLVGLKSGDSLLEIGFGQGSHLHYCRSKGIAAVGLEQNPKGAAIAQAAGLQVTLGGFDDLPTTARGFKAILAFDVIEHIPLSELFEMMARAKERLATDGKILLSFPNGASPFGRLHQHGDLTHVNAFNRQSIEQLGVATGFKLVHYGDHPEFFDNRQLAQKVKAPLRSLVRAVIKIAVKSYFDEPLGLSVVAVMEPLS